jgi:hypothetical protein
MSSNKRKKRLSPEIIESDEDNLGSPVTERDRRHDRETSQGRPRGNSDGKGYDVEDGRLKCARSSAPRPPPRGYRAHPREMRPGSDWEGRYTPGLYHGGSSSSSRLPYRRSRSSDIYSRGAERGGWWGNGKDDWSRPTGGRHEEYGPPLYNDDKYAYELEAYDAHSGRRQRWYSPGEPGPMKRANKAESNMEPPTKRPIQLDRYQLVLCFLTNRARHS